LAGSYGAIIHGMNARGTLVGTYQAEGSLELLGFRGIGGMHVPVPLLEPRGVNTAKAVVGNYVTFDGVDRIPVGFLLDGGRFETIAFTQSEASQTTAKGVNDALTVVGDMLSVLDNRWHAYRRLADGTMQLIDPPFPTLFGAGATAINNLGDIVGGFDDRGWMLIDGTYHIIDGPGILTLPLTINDARRIGGVMCDDVHCWGFVINGDLSLVAEVRVPGAIYTEVVGIQPSGRLAVNAKTDWNAPLQGYLAKKGGRR
jgi:hypothetical protein